MELGLYACTEEARTSTSEPLYSKVQEVLIIFKLVPRRDSLVYRRHDSHTVPDQDCKVSLHDAIPLTAIFASGSKWCNQVSYPITFLARKSSAPFSYCSKRSLHTVSLVSLWVFVNIFRTHLAQNFLNCNCFNILHTLSSPIPTCCDNSFTVTRLSVKSGC